MNLLELKITNFKSYQKTQVFKFSKKFGFYFVTGENQQEERLGANGAGKSSSFEALCWLFFGKTSNGLKAGDIANWEIGKNAVVELDYEFEDKKYTVKRTWSPNSWSLLDETGEVDTLVPDSQENRLYAHLKLSYESFLHCCFLAQGEPMFLDLKPADKAALFSQVMNLDKWLDYSTKASKQASEQDRIIRTKENQLSELKGSLQSIKTVDFTQQLEEWEDQQKLKIKEKEKEFKTLIDKDLVNAKKLLQTYENSIKVHKDQALLLKKEVQEQLLNIKKVEDDRQKFINDLTKSDTLRSEINKQIKYLENNDHCKICLQDITGKHKQEQFSHFEKEKTTIDDKIKSLHGEISLREDDLEFKESQIQVKEKELDEANSKVHQAELKLQSVHNEIKQINKDLDKLENEIEKISKETNPYQHKQTDLKQKVRNIQKDIRFLEKEIDDELILLSTYTFWIKGFKDVRLYLINEALQQLEIEVNSCLGQLGLNDWKILFAIDRETKSGTIQRGFNVKINSPASADIVPFESYSGGEAQRLRLACAMGLANLIRSSTGATINLEIFDEPTQFLNQDGINDLLECLKTRSQINKRQVYIIDHRSLGFGDFDGITKIIKSSKGSIIEQGE